MQTGIAASIVFWLVSLPGLTTPHHKVPECYKILHRALDLDYLEWLMQWNLIMRLEIRMLRVTTSKVDLKETELEGM